LYAMKLTLTRTIVTDCAILAMFAFAFTPARAQSPNVQIIPAPKQITTSTGSFPVGRDTHIALADNKSADDRFAAQDFIDDATASAGVSLSISKSRSRREILIGEIDLPSIAAALKRNGID